MKKIINILLVLILLLSTFLIYIPKVEATTATINDSDGVYVRTGPGTNYSYVTVLKNGTNITLVNTTKTAGTGCSAGWYQINYSGSTDRYVCSSLVTVNNGSTSNASNYYTTTDWGLRINENYATVRKTAGGTEIEKIWLGTNVKILSTSGDYYKISYYNGKEGYILKRLVDKYEDITATDQAYTTTLKSAGFPDSYIPFLTYLHKKHPNWIFKAEKTNKKFADAVSGEQGKNYIQSIENAYRVNDQLKEGPNWYAASSPVIAYMLDPRNYLNETNIFVFENLAYDKTNQTSNIVKTIFGTSYLAADNYVTYFMQAADEFNISPIHLATRVTQEGGTDITYSAITGTSELTYGGKTLKGFYNYYNIGAYTDSVTSAPVARGLAFAAGYVEFDPKNNPNQRPWDSQEKAIKYGARYIAVNYIAAGQNTLYYQKFNTGPSSINPAYTHQYMTNIIAPASESLKAYEAYNKLGLTNLPYVFSIPVYDNMPNDFTVHPLVGDTNNQLSSIKIDGKAITGFDKDVISYTHYIKESTTKLNVEATTVSNQSSVVGTGEITINSTTTSLVITVISQIGVEKKYTITLIKVPDQQISTVDEIIAKADVKITDSYLSGISVGTTSTTLANIINQVEPNAIIKITNSSGTTKTTVLATGDLITIEIDQDKKTYIIAIKGDTNGDGKADIVDLLRVQKHILNSIALTGAQYQASDTNYDSKVDIVDLLRVQKHILGSIKLK